MFEIKMHLFNKFALVCAYSRMQTALCSECAFSGLEGALPRESYAFVLRNGAASLAQVWREAKECREFPALSGVSAYCERCRAITWLSRNTDPQQALLDMQARDEQWRGLYAALAPGALNPEPPNQ